MDKKGQTLIIFVILIPILLTVFALVVDVGILIRESLKTRGIIDNGIELYFEKNDRNEIMEILKLNDIPVENLSMKEFDSSIEVTISYSIDSIFGKLINITHYDIDATRVGKIEEGHVVITKKG